MYESNESYTQYVDFVWYKENQQKFFAENAKKPGVKVIEGMQYKVIKEGTGLQPTEKDSV